MRTAVHTRRIVDPLWGAKTTGTAGSVGFGLLAAGDEAPGRQLAGEPNPFLGERRDFYIARSQLSLGRSNYLGAIVTDTAVRRRPQPGRRRGRLVPHGPPRRERDVPGHDHGGARRPVVEARPRRPGLVFVREQARLFITQMEHYDRGFQMDTAFLNQVGITQGWSFLAPSFYPDAKKHPWFKRFVPFVFAQYGHDEVQGGNKLIFVPGLRMHFTRQGFFRIDGLFGQEPWAQQTFKPRNIRVFGQAQFTRWLNIYAQLERGRRSTTTRSTLPRPLPLVPHRGEPAAERALQPEGDLRPRGVRPPDRQLAGLHRERPQHEDDVPAQPPLLRARARAIRQLARDRPHRLPGLVGAAAGHGRPTRGTGHSSSGRTGTASSSSRRPGAYRTTERGLFFKASYVHRF